MGSQQTLPRNLNADLALSRQWLVVGLAIAMGYSFGLIWRTYTQHVIVDDFVSYYGGARALGNVPNLYDEAVNHRLQIQATGHTGPDLTFIRLPWFALLVWPLGQLPYGAAYTLWFVLRLLAVAGFIYWWPHAPRSHVIIACCLSLPLAAALYNGQDVPLLLLWIGLWQKFEHDGRPFAGGLALSLCIAKYNLLLLVPLLLILHRRKLTILGAATGVAILGAISFLVQPDWPQKYVELLSHRMSNPSQALMPNIHGLLGVSGAPELILALLVAATAAVLIYRSDFLTGLAVALIGSFLISHHAFVADGLILIPAILILYQRPQVGRAVSIILGLPIVWVLVWNRA